MAKRGRRPVEQDSRLSVHVDVRFSQAKYDRLFATARQLRLTIPALLRRAADRELANFGSRKLEDPPS